VSVAWQQIWMAVATVAAGVFIFIIHLRIAIFKKYMDTSLEPTQAQHANAILNAVESAAVASVEALNQTVVHDLKANGIFNSVMGAEIKATAVQQVKSQLGPALTGAANNLFGDFEQIVATKIEQAVWRAKSHNVSGGAGDQRTLRMELSNVINKANIVPTAAIGKIEVIPPDVNWTQISTGNV